MFALFLLLPFILVLPTSTPPRWLGLHQTKAAALLIPLSTQLLASKNKSKQHQLAAQPFTKEQ